MIKYICSKDLQLEKYGDDGESLEDVMEVEEGTIWEVEETAYNMVASNEGIRLINEGQWIEIYSDTLNEYFEQSDNKAQNIKLKTKGE